MGFLNDATSGYQKYKNTRGYTNEDLYRLLSDVELSFGTLELGKVGKKDAVVCHMEGTRFDIYASADKKNIEIARVLGKDESVGKHVAKELGVGLLLGSNAMAKDQAEADRAVDELADVVNQLLETGRAKSKVSVSTGGSTKLYMKQKVISIKDKYSICTMNEEPVYWVESNLVGLSFSVQTANGDELMVIKKKLVALMPEYTLLQGKKNEIGHIKKKLKLTRPEIVGEIDGQELEIKGDMTGYHFSISLDGAVVGTVDTERLTWGDCYSIEILDNSKKDIVVAIAIICDNSLKNK